MRGSSLAYPAVLETLRPFIITYASAREVENFPADVRQLCADAGFRKHINIGLLVLDANGKLLRQLSPFIQPPAFNFDPEAQGKDFKKQIDRMLEGVPIPKLKEPIKPKLALPDVPGDDALTGARIYLTFGANRLNHYRTPTVEAVPTTKEMRQSLQYPKEATVLKMDALRPWLEQIYPPAIMDGKGGFASIDAALTLRPAGQKGDARYALVEGEVDFALDNLTRITYRGKLTATVEYANDSPEPRCVRGVCECIFPKTNPQGQVVERIRMTASIESRPK